ncbi:hypothetical protein [Streptomyces monomycini]|uniref:hypothetical protein n=1 Tax=Streptomyces monomycini TaxID=371720 RepID=UPI0004AB2C7C|nr:hypothetical protein [Streptomyces monomycini]
MSENQPQNPYGSYDPYQPQDQRQQPQQPAHPQQAAADPQAPYDAHGSYGSGDAYGTPAPQSYGGHGGHGGAYGQAPQQGYGQQPPQQPYEHQAYGTPPYGQQQPPQQHPQQTYDAYGRPQQSAWPAAAGQQQSGQYGQQGQTGQAGQYGQQNQYGRQGQAGQYGQQSQGGQYGQQGQAGRSGQYATGPDGRPAYGQASPGATSYGSDAYTTGDDRDGPQTQTWTAPTWDTSVQLPVVGGPDPGGPGQSAPDPSAAEETAYLPKQSPEPATARAPQPQPPSHAQSRHRGAPEPERSADEPTPDLSRLAPNQRARAEGRSPIIPPGLQPAAVTAVLALLLAFAAPLPRVALSVPVVLLQAVTAAGWFRLNGMWPARQGIALAFLAGVTTDIALLATERDQAPVVAIGTLGVWCLFVLVLQLRNRSSADERMYALTAGLTSTALVVLAAGQLAATNNAVTVGCVAVAVTALARALPLPSAASLVVALLGGAGAGIAAGQLTGLGASGALLGLVAGGCALIGLRVASYDYPSRFVHMTAGVALPLTLAAPAIYVLGRALA